jgi:hypothetical protein
VEQSRHFAGYKVTDLYLEFVEPDDTGIIQELHLQASDDEYKHVTQLAQAVWQCVTDVALPDVTHYNADIKGVELFELDLLSRVQ